MAVVSYKCPNCDGPLKFKPDIQQFLCEYCLSKFDKTSIERPAETDSSQEKVDNEVEQQKDINENINKSESDSDESKREEFAKEAIAYSCPSCGAEIITTTTTAATTCYYCHNPVIISGRLDKNLKPDKIIPFYISREKAVERFKELCAKKKFLPPDFYSESQIEKLAGIYYPYWLIGAEVEGAMTSNARKTRTWQTGNMQYTETTNYRLIRNGKIDLHGISVTAFKNEDRDIFKYVCPYDDEKRIEFAMSYLSGFQAEKRDLEKTDLREEVQKKVKSISENTLQDTMKGFGAVTSEIKKFNIVNENWEYVLYPIWIMTYIFNGTTYRYALNGQTGKIYGELPVSKTKLSLLFASVVLTVFILVFLLIGGIL